MATNKMRLDDHNDIIENLISQAANISVGENVTAETNTQIEIIGEMATKFGVAIDEATGTNKNKLQVNNTNLQKISQYCEEATIVDLDMEV